MIIHVPQVIIRMYHSRDDTLGKLSVRPLIKNVVSYIINLEMNIFDFCLRLIWPLSDKTSFMFENSTKLIVMLC